jgi:hypothetical protein
MGFSSVNDTLSSQENYAQGYYLATVTANNDTVGIGRVQAKIPGLFDPDQGEVPYIGPTSFSPYGFGVGDKGPYGVYGTPQVGSDIRVELQKGDENKALYISQITAKSRHPWFNTPSRWGYVDPAGNSLQVDMQSGAWTWTHQSGDTIAYDGSGNVVRVVKGSETDNVSGSITFNVTGDANINCSNFNMHANGTATYTASQHQFNGPIQGSSTIAAAGDITDLTGQGNTKTVGNMRTVYDSHDHNYTDDGNLMVTQKPNQQI